jgi:hypothetical protein
MLLLLGFVSMIICSILILIFRGLWIFGGVGLIVRVVRLVLLVFLWTFFYKLGFFLFDYYEMMMICVEL